MNGIGQGVGILFFHEFELFCEFDLFHEFELLFWEFRKIHGFCDRCSGTYCESVIGSEKKLYCLLLVLHLLLVLLVVVFPLLSY